MKNGFFWIAAVVIYIAVLALLGRKAEDIFRHPERYREIAGWREYRSSFWYEPRSDYHKLFSKTYAAGIIVSLPLYLGLVCAYIFAATLIQKLLFIPAEGMYLHGDDRWSGFCGAVFYAIELEFWILYHCKKPIAVACTMTAFNSRSRSEDWKKLVCGMLVASAICLPVMLAGLDTYAYATEKTLVVNKFFRLSEIAVDYDKAERIETRYSPYKDESGYNIYYLITVNGEETDLWNYCNVKELVELHQRFEAAGADIQKAAVDRNTYANMQKVWSESKMAMAEALFETP